MGTVEALGQVMNSCNILTTDSYSLCFKGPFPRLIHSPYNVYFLLLNPLLTKI